MTVSVAIEDRRTSENLTGPALLQRNWGWILARGVLAILLGCVAFLFPVDALYAFTLVFAVFAGADGIVSLVAGVAGAAAREERWGLLVLRGLLGIGFAVLFALSPDIATLGYALSGVTLFAAWAIAAGILEILAAVRLRRSIADEWLLSVAGLLSVALGLFVWMAFWAFPLLTLLTVGWMIAGWALLSGVMLIALALRLRRLHRHSAA
ncbi:MAG: HdeD family acid-resistance protein [Sphingomonadales bacterium]|nr:MAG: HdeD family acid-resistance protein [Sphingomonadales bacterium]